MAKITFYIVRHGKTLMNTLDMVQGWCDSPLTNEGIKVAEKLGKGMTHITFRSAYCSTLRRTLQTAQTILSSKGQHDLPITEVEGFKEAGFGSYEAGPNKTMWTHAALYCQHKSFDEMYQAIVEKKTSYDEVLDAIHKLDTMGLAENAEMVKVRTQKALREVAEKEILQGDGNILIIAHGMCILSMLGSMGGDKLLDGHLENAAVCKVEYEDGEFTVLSMGDMSYVKKANTLVESI